MKWFYAVSGAQQGPVDEAELARLHGSGVITDGSLVWREGLAEWQPYVRVFPAAPPPLTTAVSVVAPPLLAGAAPGVRCVECGREFPPDQVIQIGTGACCAGCKPLVVQKVREGVTVNPMDAIRREHLGHEASIKSVGGLYFVGAALLIAGAIAVLLGARRGPDGPVSAALLNFAFAGGGIAGGIGLRRLQPWGRVVSALLSVIGLVGSASMGALGAIGIVIYLYILYLLFSKKGRRVFSAEYREVIAATPHIQHKTSLIVKIVAVLLLLLLVAVLVSAVAKS